MTPEQKIVAAIAKYPGIDFVGVEIEEDETLKSLDCQVKDSIADGLFGDSLFSFLVSEILSVTEDVADSGKVSAAAKAIETAISDLQAVLNALEA